MKKKSKRQIKDYSKYTENDYEYYGLLPKKGKLRVDVKRLLKQLSISDEIKTVLNKPRKTVYFIPKKVYKYEYNINYFKDEFGKIKKSWHDEFKPIIKHIETPKEYGDKAFSGYFLQTGILSPDEVSIQARMREIERYYSYSKAIISFYAQFFHQFASRIEAITISVLRKNEYDVDHFSRQTLKDIYNGATKKQIESLSTYKYYDQFYKIWNFLKHNSVSTYNKINNNYPEFLINPDSNKYENGNLGQYHLKLDNKIIEYFFINLELFFNEFCESIFFENVSESEWNYNQYFYEIVKDEIELRNNPLGLPGWL